MPHSIDRAPEFIKVKYWGTLTVEDVRIVVDTALNAENIKYVNRVEDIREVDYVSLGFRELMDFSRKLKNIELPHAVKTAILTGNPLQYGIARMFQMIVDHPHMKIEVFSEEEKAINWISSAE